MKTKIFLLFLILQFLNILILNNVYAKKDAVYWYNKGVDATDLDKKIEYYTKAIELNPEYAEAYCNRGFAYDNKGEYDRAIEDYNKAIELNPEFAEVYNNRGLAYFIQKFPTTACGDFYQAEEYYI